MLVRTMFKRLLSEYLIIMSYVAGQSLHVSGEMMTTRGSQFIPVVFCCVIPSTSPWCHLCRNLMD
jgi:hypothetical protein